MKREAGEPMIYPCCVGTAFVHPACRGHEVIRRSCPSRPRSLLRESAANDLGKDDCVIVVPISGGVDKGECALTCAASELLEPRPFVTKLVEVAASEFLEAARVVSEPPS